MDVVVAPDRGTAVQLVAALIAARLRAEPDITLGLATGRTMEPLYAELVRLHRHEGLSFARCRSVNLDEYVGLPPAHPNSYRRFMQDQLFDHVDIRPDRTHLPDGTAPDAAAEAARYEREIAAGGGIGLQLLGLGSNGHIGFNEPGSPFTSRTREVRLSADTRQQNAEMFGGDPDAVPPCAITMGVATILGAREVVLLATGAAKAGIVSAMLDGPVDPAVTATALRTHARCHAVLDRDAASELEFGRFPLVAKPEDWAAPGPDREGRG
jgi:glucosamine-6-phosphate deaminase